MSSYFFNGRLYITPAVMSAVNDSALAAQNPGVGNVLAILGLSTNGAPKTPLTFTSPSQALATLQGGELCDAVVKAFAPSDETGGPASVIAIRVNPALQSSLVLSSVATPGSPSINLTSRDYGQNQNQLAVQVMAGSVQGKKISVQYGSQTISQDNLYNSPFSIQYTGAQASATATIDGASSVLTLDAPAGTPIATISLASYPTVAALVAYINTLTGWAASVTGANSTWPTVGGFDALTAQDVKTANYAVTSILASCLNWLNGTGEPFLNATAGSTGLPPYNINWTYLQGGSDGVSSNTDWTNSFTALQGVDCQWVVPLSSSPSIIAMADAHVQYMSTVAFMERRAFTGGALGQTDTTAVAGAFAINSNRTSYVYPGYYDFNSTGVLTLYSPYMTAAIVGAMFAGSNPGTAMTNKTMNVQGLEVNLNVPGDTDILLAGGVLPIVKGKTGYRVVQSITTWLTDTKQDKVEQSIGWAVDYTVRSVREAVGELLGSKGNPLTMQEALAVADSELRALSVPEPQGPGVLAGDAANPPFINLTASLIGEVLGISFQCSPVEPVNYIPVSVSAVPFSGTATV